MMLFLAVVGAIAITNRHPPVTIPQVAHTARPPAPLPFVGTSGTVGTPI